MTFYAVLFAILVLFGILAFKMSRIRKLPNLPVISYIVGICRKVFAGKRRAKFMKQFLPALNQIAGMIRAGSSIEEAFGLVGEENPDPIGEEFRLLLSEYKISHDLNIALKNLALRIKSRELEIFVNAIIVSKRTGANIVEQIEKIQRTIQDRIYIEGKIKALTIQGKVQGILCVVIPPAIIFFVNLIDSTYFEPLIKTKIGKTVIFAGTGMNLIGLAIISKLSKIKF